MSAPELWEAPESWRWSNFAGVAEIAQNLVRPAEVPDSPHIAPDNIESGTRRLLEFRTVRQDGVISPKQRFFPGQILFTKIRPYLLKSVRVDFHGVCSADMYPLWPRDVIDANYLLFWLTSADFREAIAFHQGRTVLPKINQATLNQTKLPLPPLPEQRRIVARIDSLSAKSSRARAHLDHIPRLVEKYKQALLAAEFSREAFAGWEKGPLGDFVQDGQVGLVRSKEQQSSTGTPYIRMNHFNMEGVWNDDDLTYVHVTPEELRRYELREGDVLFNTRNSYELVGKVGVWPSGKPGHVYNNNLLRLRFLPHIDPVFAGLLMVSPEFRSYLQSVKSATTSVCAIYQRSVMAAPFAFPPLDEQAKIAKRVITANERIDRLAADATSARKLIAHLDQAILAKAFRGELVPQDPTDEPATTLLERIRAERQSTTARPQRAGRRT